jgi:hypothetical protein
MSFALNFFWPQMNTDGHRFFICGFLSLGLLLRAHNKMKLPPVMGRARRPARAEIFCNKAARAERRALPL